MKPSELIKELLDREEAIPLIDSGKVVTLVGGDAVIRSRAIRECWYLALKGEADADKGL